MNIKKHLQIKSYPHGDCLRTCFASILKAENVTDIPNFMEEGEHKFDENLQNWLIKNKYLYFKFLWKDVVISNCTLPQFCIVTCKKKSDGVFHSVVGYLNKEENEWKIDVIHDPLGKSIEDCVNDFDLENGVYIGFLTKELM